MTDEILGLTHECQDADCHVPGFVRTLRARLADAEARAEAAEAALDPNLTPTLTIAEWACDPLPSCPNYAHVNPDWLRSLITEAVAVRAALGCRMVLPDGDEVLDEETRDYYRQAGREFREALRGDQ